MNNKTTWLMCIALTGGFFVSGHRLAAGNDPAVCQGDTCATPAPPQSGKKDKKATPQKTAIVKNETQATFVELGSVNCRPCKMMQPVMKEIEAMYGGQVKIVFYDVWTKEGAPYADQYKIQVIPTQVFLDKDGKEFFRHAGFYPTAEIVKVLDKQGIKKAEKPADKKQ
jgi:thioredoxin 1